MNKTSEDQQAILDVCNMVINNRHVFPEDQVKKAEELRGATLNVYGKRARITRCLFTNKKQKKRRNFEWDCLVKRKK